MKPHLVPPVVISVILIAAQPHAFGTMQTANAIAPVNTWCSILHLKLFEKAAPPAKTWAAAEQQLKRVYEELYGDDAGAWQDNRDRLRGRVERLEGEEKERAFLRLLALDMAIEIWGFPLPDDATKLEVGTVPAGHYDSLLGRQ